MRACRSAACVRVCCAGALLAASSTGQPDSEEQFKLRLCLKNVKIEFGDRAHCCNLVVDSDSQRSETTVVEDGLGRARHTVTGIANTTARRNTRGKNIGKRGTVIPNLLRVAEERERTLCVLASPHNAAACS